MKKYRRNIIFFTVITLIFLSSAIIAGCQNTPDPETEEEKTSREAFYYPVPEDWAVIDEKERDSITSIKIASETHDKGQLIITLLPLDKFTSDEAVDEAKGILEKTLYEINDGVSLNESNINGKDIIMLEAEAGAMEKVYAQTAIIEGTVNYLFVTLVKRKEAGTEYDELFNSLLTEIKNY